MPEKKAFMCMIAFIRNVQKRQFYTDESKPVVAWGWEEEQGLTASGLRKFWGVINCSKTVLL